MYHIAFYVPVTYVEIVKDKMFEAGAGRLGNYENCSFEYKGIGQFRPMKGGHPFVGHEGEIERVDEVKIEMICEEPFLEASITALKKNHPYETPAYYVIKTVNI